jgi:hypothetical protein
MDTECVNRQTNAPINAGISQKHKVRVTLLLHKSNIIIIIIIIITGMTALFGGPWPPSELAILPYYKSVRLLLL